MQLINIDTSRTSLNLSIIVLTILGGFPLACEAPAREKSTSVFSPLVGDTISELIDPGTDTLNFHLQARFLKNNILLFSHSEPSIYVYSMQGEKLTTMGGEGEGPGEFALVGGVWEGQQDFWAFDPVLRRRTRFSLTEADITVGPITFSSPPYRFIGGLENGGLVVALLQLTDDSGTRGSSFDPLKLALIDSTGTPSSHLARGDGFARYRLDDGMLVMMPFSPTLLAGVRDSILYIGDAFRSRMRLHNIRHRTSSVITWPSPMGNSVRNSQLTKVKQALLRDSPETHFDLDVVLQAARESPMPLYRYMLVDGSGRIWLGEYIWQQDNTWGVVESPTGLMRRWWVVSTDGRILERFMLPARIRIEDIEGDLLLLVERDAFELESVVLLRADMQGE